MILAHCRGDARVFVSLLAERGLELVRPLLVEAFEAMRSVASSACVLTYLCDKNRCRTLFVMRVGVPFAYAQLSF